MFQFSRFQDLVNFQNAIISGLTLKELQRYLRIQHNVNMPLVFVLQLVLVRQKNPFSMMTDREEKIQEELNQSVTKLLKNLKEPR